MQFEVAPTKPPASTDSLERTPKCTKPSLKDFNEMLDKFLKCLYPGVVLAYKCIPPDHELRVMGGSAIAQADLLLHLLKLSKDEPEEALRTLRAANLSFPSFRDLSLRDDFKSHFEEFSNDLGEQFRKILQQTCEKVLAIGDKLFPQSSLPSPSKFAQGRGWHMMQADDVNAILCHRPAERSPALPVKVKHAAFHEFFNKMSVSSTPTEAELQPFAMAAMVLEVKLSSAVEQEATRGNDILAVFRGLFPQSDGYHWTLENNYKKGRIDLLCKKVSGDEDCSHILIEVKLEPGQCGNGQMQLSRMYDVYVRDNAGIRTSGIPMFLLSISGMSATLPSYSNKFTPYLP